MLKNWHVSWIRRNKFSRLDLDYGYTGNKYNFYVSLYGKLKKGASYLRHGNTTLPEHTNYNT